MRRNHTFWLSTRAGRFIGVSALITGTMSASVLGVAAPAAHAAPTPGASKVSVSRLDRLPAPGATALSSPAVREAEAAAARRSGWTQASEIPSPDPTTDDAFGYSVAISGTTMVVGAQGANSDLGVAYVFTEGASASTWTYAATLNPGGVTNDGCTPVCQEFGISVAVSSSTIVVGASGVGVNASGAAFVYTNGGAYPQQTELTDPGLSSGDNFGDPVAVSSNSIVVGASGENSNEGAVFVYNPNTFATAELPEPPGASNGDGDLFGFSLAIGGNTLVVGAPGTAGTLASEPDAPGSPPQTRGRPIRGQPPCTPGRGPAGPIGKH